MALLISEIYVYPVKGLKGIKMPESDVMEKGLKYDRRWMLIGADGKFISQREAAGLALIQTSLVGESLVISYRESSVMLPLDNKHYTGIPEKVKIWNDVVEATQVGNNFNEWFSDVLNMKVRLCFMSEQSDREVEKEFGARSTVSFADAYPVMLLTEASMADLNSRLPEPLNINRFRPNIVVAGADAFEEDNWGLFSAGEALFRGIKTCGRCNVPNIDQETGIVGKEPIRTLARYRKKGTSIKFGLYNVVEREGKIKVGDVISLL